MPVAAARQLHLEPFRVTLNRLDAFHVGIPVPGFIQEIFATQFKKRLQGNGMTYEHRLIDDMVAATLKWEDGFI
jgi:isocitrate dehydrogenase